MELKGLPDMKPIGTMKVMAQHPCYADSPMMPLPLADKDLTGRMPMTVTAVHRER